MSRRYFAPIEVNAGEWTNGGIAPCEGDFRWRAPAEVQACGGSRENPVAIEIPAPDSDKSITLELTAEDARWLASKMLEIAHHHDRNPPPDLPPQRPMRLLDPDTGLPWGN